MKKITQIISSLMILFLLAFSNNYAQEEENPLLVVSYNMVPMSKMGEVSRVTDSLFTPILKEMVDEGFIYNYGRFNHFWGDEWNFNMWYTAKDLTAFDKFWNEFVNRMNKRHPGSFAMITRNFQAHKDNIYSIQSQYPEPK